MAKMKSKVDLLGLDEFGENPGMSPLFGAMIGAGVSNASAIIARQATDPMSKIGSNSELVGFGVGMAVSGILYAMGEGTRHAAVAAAAATALSTGLRLAEKMFFSPPAGATAGIGLPFVQQLGIPVVNPLGLPEATDISHTVYGRPAGVPQSLLHGNGVAGTYFGDGVPVDLLGNQSASAAQVALLGGPTIHGLASHYGKSLFG